MIYSIYKLTCQENGLSYYGSTKRSLKLRLSQHKNTLNTTSRLLISPIIQLIEEIETDNRKEAHEREAYYIRNFPCVNKNIPNRSNDQYVFEEYEKVKGRYTCCCGSSQSKDHKARHETSKRHVKFLQNNNVAIL